MNGIETIKLLDEQRLNDRIDKELNRDKITVTINEYDELSCFECGSLKFIMIDSQYKTCLECGTLKEDNFINEKIIDTNDNPENILFNNHKHKIKFKNTENSMKLLLDKIMTLGKFIESDKDTIVRSLLLYINIKKYIKKRSSSEMGMIAACYFYVCRNNHIIISDKELIEKFNVEKKKITEGFKQINIVCRSDKTFINLINRDIITIMDIFEKIRHEFKRRISDDHYDKIESVFNQLKNNYMCKRNTPTPVACGIFYAYITHNKLTISKSEIVKKIKVSESSINKYVDVFKHIINYDPYVSYRGGGGDMLSSLTN